jgi:hypothetical protein
MEALRAPALSVSVVIGRELSAFATPEAMALASQATERELAGLLTGLGLPGEPSVTVAAGAAGAAAQPDDGSSLMLIIGGVPCLFPWSLALEAYAWLSGQPTAPPRIPDDLDGLTAASLIALTCREAAKLQPAVLLTPAQAEHYCLAAGIEVTGTSAARVHRVLQGIVGLGRSIADQATVRRVLAADQDPGIGTRETLLTELGGVSLTLQVAPGYLRQLTLDYPDTAGEIAELRKSLFSELGAVPPAVRLVACDSLPPGTFSLRINDLETLPVTGLAAGQLIVNSTADQLREHDIPAQPSRFAHGAIIGEESRVAAEALGLTAYDQMRYLVISLMGLAQARFYQLVDRTQVEELLTITGRPNSWLTDAARAIVPLDLLTAVLRELIADSLTIPSLRPVLDALIELAMNSDQPALDDWVSAARAALREDIGIRALQGQATGVASLVLDPATEDAMSAAARTPADSWLPPDVAASLVFELAGKVRAELGNLAAADPVPALLARRRARSLARSVLRAGFPQVLVISYDDLAFPVFPQVKAIISAGVPEPGAAEPA